MTAEKFPGKTPDDGSSEERPAIVPPFEIPRFPLDLPDSTEKSKKKRNRRRGRGRDRDEDRQPGTTPAGRPKEESKQPGRAEMPARELLWDRLQEEVKPGSKLLGKKVVEAANADSTDSEAEAPHTDAQMAEPSAELQAGVEAPAEAASAPAGLQTSAEARTHEVAANHPADHPTELDSTEAGMRTASESVHPAVELPATYHAASRERLPEPPPPPMPPDLIAYHRRLMSEPVEIDHGMEPPEPPTFDGGYVGGGGHDDEPPHREPPASVPHSSGHTGRVPERFASDLTPGLQRSPADVRRAAWTGVFAGWMLGRRGKRRAVEAAQGQGQQAAERAQRRAYQAEAVADYEHRRAAIIEHDAGRTVGLQAEPLHTYPVPETSRATVASVSVESRQPHRVEAVAVAAAAASVVAFERARPRSEIDRREVPPTARRVASKATEAVLANSKPEALRPVTGARAEQQLGKRELLNVAKDIKVDGVSLKEVYNAKQIDDEGLRSVVDTYLRGGDVRQQLTREVVNKERSYEVDPRIRHDRRQAERNHRSGRSSGSGGFGEKVSNALGQAGALAAEKGGQWVGSAGHASKLAANATGRAATRGAKTAQRNVIDNSNTGDWVGITAVVIVYAIILLLWVG